MHSSKLEDLKTRRSSLTAEMKSILDRPDFGDHDQSDFESLERQVGDLDRDIASLERISSKLDEINAREGGQPQPIGPDTPLDDVRGDFRRQGLSRPNTLTSRTVTGPDGTRMPALGPKDSLFSIYRERRDIDSHLPTDVRDACLNGDLTLGDYIRAVVLGPTRDIERRALSVVPDASGGYDVPQVLGSQFVDLLRNQSVVLRMGATVLPLESMWHHIAGLASDPTVGWRAENAQFNESEPTFRRIEFKPESLAVLTKVSYELLQDALHMPEALTRSMTAAMALELDRAYLYGSGAASEPTGLDTLVTTNVIDKTSTAAADWDDIVDLQVLLEQANAPATSGVATNPQVRGTFSKSKGSDNHYLDPPSQVAGIPWMVSNQIPSTDLWMGAWSDVVVGTRLPIRLQRLDERYAEFGQVAWTAFARSDINIWHETSMGKIVNIQ